MEVGRSVCTCVPLDLLCIPHSPNEVLRMPSDRGSRIVNFYQIKYPQVVPVTVGLKILSNLQEVTGAGCMWLRQNRAKRESMVEESSGLYDGDEA